MLSIAAITTGPAGPDPAVARAATEAPVAEAAASGAGLVVLPELFALPYFAGDEPARWRHLAEPLDGPTGRWAGALAARLGIALLFGMALVAGAGAPLNAAVLARPDGGLSLAAAKINLPPAHGFGEADHFRPGLPIRPLPEIGGARLGILVCYDRRYPESWRALAEAGADLVAVLVAGPAPADPPGIYLAELRTHARANALPVIAAARCGTEQVTGHPVTHDGDSLALDGGGAVIAIAPARSGGMARLDLSPADIVANRQIRALRTGGRHAYAINEENNPS